MNAKEFSKAVEDARKINGVDEWIATEMLAKAASKSIGEKNVVSFNSSYFYNKGWRGDAVASHLISRGFKVEKRCDGRPCGDVWYEISW
jgi:ABC-type branched-subunit amino acid transport system substrate-binding protein